MSLVKYASRHALNIVLIEQALQGAQAAMARRGGAPTKPRDELTDAVIAKMLDGYRYIDRAVTAEEDWLAMGQSHSILTLNNLVLYGKKAASEEATEKPQKSNERHFYKDPPGGFGEFLESMAMTIKVTPYSLPAEAFIRTLTSPQLFLEGNHRTGSLIMSYLLLQAGLPPFVLSGDNYKAFFSISEDIRLHQKGTLPLLIHKFGFRLELHSLLVNNANPEYLRPAV